MLPRPTEASPAGCVVALFGIAAWIYAALCAWAIHLAGQLPQPPRDADLVFYLWIKFSIAFVLGFALLWFGFRWAMVSDMSDRHNPDKPMIRF